MQEQKQVQKAGFSVKKYVVLVVVTYILVVIDQLTKWYAMEHIHYGAIKYVHKYLNWTLVHNPGGAFGFLAQCGENVRMGVFIAIVSVTVLAMIVFYIYYFNKSRWACTWLLMIIGGAIGNLIDRIRFGYVIDFIDVHLYDKHWPAFNFADICVTVGLFCLIIYIVFEGVWRPKHL